MCVFIHKLVYIYRVGIYMRSTTIIGILCVCFEGVLP